MLTLINIYFISFLKSLSTLFWGTPGIFLRKWWFASVAYDQFHHSQMHGHGTIKPERNDYICIRKSSRKCMTPIVWPDSEEYCHRSINCVANYRTCFSYNVYRLNHFGLQFMTFMWKPEVCNFLLLTKYQNQPNNDYCCYSAKL